VRVAVLLAGSGSSADFVRRAFGAALAGAGYGLVAPEPVPGPSLVPAAFAALDDAVRREDVALVGGVSLGAHVAVRWAAERSAAAGIAGVLAALPAWTGPPGTVAAASERAAAEVERVGAEAAVARARAAGVRWVADELAAAWPRYGDALPATLRAAAAAPGPDPAELARTPVPVGIAAFRDDPLHPAGVAAEWATLLPLAAVEELTLADLAADRAPLGAAALRAWSRAVRQRGAGPCR